MNKMPARLFGIFFIFSFISYAIGIALMEVVQNTQSLPGAIIDNKNQIISGGILIIFFHTLFNLGVLLIMFNVLKHINNILSCFYVALGAFGTFLLASGAIFLLLPISLYENITQSDNAEILLLQPVLSLCSKGNFYSYQSGMALWGSGGIILCYLLYQSKLVHRFFPFFGLAGYLIFITGILLELFGYPYGIILSVPGALFEIMLSGWLIFKGFRVVKNTI